MNKKVFLPFVIVCIFAAAISLLVFNTSSHQKSKTEPIQYYVKIGEKKIKVDLALTREEQERGLSGRTPLRIDEGMLFIFDHPGKYPFWMKDMNFPIDMIWLMPKNSGDDKNLKIVYIKQDARPESYPKAYGPDNAEAKYVLEVVSGFSQKYNLKVGDGALFTY